MSYSAYQIVIELLNNLLFYHLCFVSVEWCYNFCSLEPSTMLLIQSCNIRKEGNVLFNGTHHILFTVNIASDILQRMTQIAREETFFHHYMSYIFYINIKGSFICTIQQIILHISQSLLYQSLSTGWNEKYLGGSMMTDWSDHPSHHEQALYHCATSCSKLHNKDLC